MDKKTLEDFTCCPHCESDSGVFTKDHVKGYIEYHSNYDGSDGENTDMNDSIVTSRAGKVYYCVDCRKKVCNV